MANEIGSVSQEGNSEIKLVLNEKSSVNSEIKSKSSEISSTLIEKKSTINNIFDEKTSEINTTLEENSSEISTTFDENTSEIVVSLEESPEIQTIVNSEPSSIEVSLEKESTPIQVVSEFLSEHVLSVRVRGDDKGPQTGDVVLDPSSIPHFHPDTYYEKGDVIIYDYKLYEAKNSFTSGISFNLDDWNSISTELTILSSDDSVQINTSNNRVDLSVSQIVESEKIRAEEVENQLRELIEKLDLKIVQSDWNEEDSNSQAFIKNKPTKLSEFENDEGFVKSSEVYKKNEIDLSNTVITLDDASVKTYDILTLAK